MPRLLCPYCAEKPQNWKALFEHYQKYHAQHLKRYLVVNKSGKGQGMVEATSEAEACKFFGWDWLDCDISEVK